MVPHHGQYWSSRALFVHGVKRPELFEKVARRWTTSRPTPSLRMGCFPCTRNGYNVHQGSWTYARLPCPAAEGRGRFCSVDVASTFTCCGFPWLLPEVREIALGVLRSAGSGLPFREVNRRMREAARALRVKENKGCVRDCLNLRLPAVDGLLEELERRGEVRLQPLPAGLSPNQAKARRGNGARMAWLRVNETLPVPPALEMWRLRPDGLPGP